MPTVMKQIDQMSLSEKMQTLEYLWSSMSASVVAQPPAWHAAILAERRRQYDAGEIGSMSVAESKRRLQEAIDAR
ncbi:MAG: addiction module protein [Kiritimatiellae bacterium]|nr:addiction module protein [Kiritimatiellia bacterium]